MNRRLAITISGAVSLGAYEAGVLYEILQALKAHNTSGPDPITVDVLVGASAGGMTAAIVAQKILYEASTLDDPVTNALRLPWVVQADLLSMLRLEKQEPQTHSILSSNLIERIARQSLTARYELPTVPTQTRHPACADQIRLGMALSNLNGVPYTLALEPQREKFTYVVYQDQFKVSLDPAADSLGVWEPIRNAAVACGAFPFAFRVKDIARSGADYAGSELGAGVQLFTYTDGGVFQNEPLGLAKDLVDTLDNHLNTESRFYLFVSPNGRNASSNRNFHEAVATLDATAGALVTALIGQAQFQDWIRAQKTNAQIGVLDSVARTLAGLLAAATINAAQLQAIADAVTLKLGWSAQEKKDRGDRLKAQYVQEVAQAGSPAGGNALVAALMLLEFVAGFESKEQMQIYSAVASDEELAGSPVNAFQGFFDQRYRQHDYEVGRNKARALIAAIQNSPNDPLHDIRYAAAPIPIAEPALAGLKMSQVDHGLRERVRDRLLSRAHDMMKEIGFNPLVREAIDLFALRGQVNHLLEL